MSARLRSRVVSLARFLAGSGEQDVDAKPRDREKAGYQLDILPRIPRRAGLSTRIGASISLETRWRPP
jgi:hypothetical protein